MRTRREPVRKKTTRLVVALSIRRVAGERSFLRLSNDEDLRDALPGGDTGRREEDIRARFSVHFFPLWFLPSSRNGTLTRNRDRDQSWDRGQNRIPCSATELTPDTRRAVQQRTVVGRDPVCLALE